MKAFKCRPVFQDEEKSGKNPNPDYEKSGLRNPEFLHLPAFSKQIGRNRQVNQEKKDSKIGHQDFVRAHQTGVDFQDFGDRNSEKYQSPDPEKGNDSVFLSGFHNERIRLKFTTETANCLLRTTQKKALRLKRFDSLSLSLSLSEIEHDRERNVVVFDRGFCRIGQAGLEELLLVIALPVVVC